MCMLMVPVYDVALAVAAVVIVSIDFPYDRLRRPADPANSLDQCPRVRKRGAYRRASAVAVLSRDRV